MARAGFSLSSTGAREYRDLAKKIRKAKATDIRKELRDAIATTGKPITSDVQAAVRDLHITSSHGGGTARRTTFASLQAARRAHKRGADVRKAAVRAARRPHGLRDSVARAVKLQITARGVRYVVNSAQLPESQRSLPRHLDSAKGWRHPVFGDKSVWVSQKGGPWFSSTISRKSAAFRRSILDAMDRATRKLEQ